MHMCVCMCMHMCMCMYGACGAHAGMQCTCSADAACVMGTQGGVAHRVSHVREIALHVLGTVELLQRDDVWRRGSDLLAYAPPAPLPVDNRVEVAPAPRRLQATLERLHGPGIATRLGGAQLTVQLQERVGRRRALVVGRHHVAHMEAIVGHALGENVPRHHPHASNDWRLVRTVW